MMIEACAASQKEDLQADKEWGGDDGLRSCSRRKPLADLSETTQNPL